MKEKVSQTGIIAVRSEKKNPTYMFSQKMGVSGKGQKLSLLNLSQNSSSDKQDLDFWNWKEIFPAPTPPHLIIDE